MILTKEQRIYLSLWRKAVNDSEPLRVEFETMAQAMSFRRAMYRAIIPYRLMKLHDPVLSEAIDRWGVHQPKSLAEGEKPYCIIREREGVKLAEELERRFNLSEHMFSTEEEAEAAASSEKLLRELGFLSGDDDA